MASAIAHPSAEIDRPKTAQLLKALVWGFCLLLIAGIWWVVIAQIGFERQQAISEGVRQNVNRTIAFEQFVRRTLEGADMATRYVAERYARGSAGGEFSGTPANPAHLRGGIARSGTYLGVSVLNRRGDIVATSVPASFGRLPNVADHPAFRVHVERDTGRMFVSPPQVSRILGRPVIWLSRRLNNPDGSFAGVVAVNISPNQFTSFSRDAEVSQMDVMSVIGFDGVTRARRTGPTASAGEDLRGTRVMREQMASPNGTYLGPSALDGVVRYFSHRRLQDYPLFVTYGVLESELLAPSRHRARIFVAGASLVSLVILAFAALLTFYLNRRDRREAELAWANARLQEAQRIGQIGDWDYDLRTGAVYWSPQLCAQYERRPEDGSPGFEEFLSYLDDDGRAAVRRAHAEATRTGESQEIEYEVRMPSGAESRHQGVVIPSVDATGNVVRLHGTDQNISARKLLDRLQTHVAHLSRVEAMNAMAATLAHELNQPLTAASNYLVGSRRRLRAGTIDEVERGMIAAEHQVHLAADIIRRVREMVANQPKSVASVSLSRIVDDAVALISVGSLFPRLALRRELAADARSVRADRIQIQQVMVNLIRNACDATEARPAPEVLISSRRDEAGMVVVSVTDNGPGFSQAEGERFSPFASTKNAGLGLGLSISRTIIEAHGGRIWIEGEAGEGARVSFALRAPRRQADLDAAHTAAA